MLDVLIRAGQPTSTDRWTELATEAGLSSKRRAWAWDLRNVLLKKGLVYEGVNGWAKKGLVYEGVNGWSFNS